MANSLDVKSYLACWFQLGRSVIATTPRGQQQIKPHRVLALQGLSQEFEDCWGQISARPEQCYLEGTHESVADLLSDRWQIESCCRCGLPVPFISTGPDLPGPCPCATLSTWPNDQTIPPRYSEDGFQPQEQLDRIRQRLDPGQNRVTGV